MRRVRNDAMSGYCVACLLIIVYYCVVFGITGGHLASSPIWIDHIKPVLSDPLSVSFTLAPDQRRPGSAYGGTSCYDADLSLFGRLGTGRRPVLSLCSFFVFEDTGAAAGAELSRQWPETRQIARSRPWKFKLLLMRKIKRGIEEQK